MWMGRLHVWEDKMPQRTQNDIDESQEKLGGIQYYISAYLPQITFYLSFLQCNEVKIQ
jgi:hypothetical protein